MKKRIYQVEIYIPGYRVDNIKDTTIKWEFTSAVDALDAFGGLHNHLWHNEWLRDENDVYMILRSITGHAVTQHVFIKIKP
jgi:hypothetical protein